MVRILILAALQYLELDTNSIHVLNGSENKNKYVRDMAIEKEETTKSAHFPEFIVIVTAVDFV